MYAFVKGKSGSIYQSMVFGCYKEKFNGYDFFYYVVLDESKKKLVKQYGFEKTSRVIKKLLLITDCDTSDWNVEDDCGQINLFDKNLPELVESNSISDDLLQKCISMDKEYVYEECPEIKSEQNIKNLDWAAGNFHDSYITKLEFDKASDSIHICFEGCWGCSIEMWFSDIVSLNVHSDDIKCDYWFGASMYFQDGYFCLINEENTKISEETSGYNWFSGKKAKYKIIPTF